MCFHLQITGSCTFFCKRSCGLRPLWLQQFTLNPDQCLDCILHRSHWVAIFLPSRTQKGHPVIQKAPNAAPFFTLLYIISVPPVHLMICRMRPVTPLPPPFHLRHRRSVSRSRGGRRSRSRERDRSRRRGHDREREREKERDRGRGRDTEGDRSKERADKKR